MKKQTVVSLVAPAPKPEVVKAIRGFAKARVALTEGLQGATRLDVVLAVGHVTGCPVKKAVGGKALTDWVLDSKHAEYENAKTLLRDVMDSLAGKESRGKKQAAAKKAAAKQAAAKKAAAKKAASKTAKPEDVFALYLEMDAKGRAAFRKMAKLKVAN